MAAAIAGGRAQASGLLLLALERPAAHYMQLCSLMSMSLTVLDGFSDPHGWGSLLGGQAARGGDGGGGSNNGHVVPLPGILAAADGPQQLQQQLSAAAAAAGLQQCIVIDSLSPLLDAWGPAAVAQLLHSLQAAPATSCLLCGVHADLHPPATIAALEQLAAGSLQVGEASELECSMCTAAHGATPQGRLAVQLKRAAGRVRAESQLYAIDASSAVTFLEPPADLLNAAAAAGKAAGAAAGGEGARGVLWCGLLLLCGADWQLWTAHLDLAAVSLCSIWVCYCSRTSPTGLPLLPCPHAGDAASGLAQQLAGGMRLGLSRAEAEAKARVQLPFEHQGQVGLGCGLMRLHIEVDVGPCVLCCAAARLQPHLLVSLFVRHRVRPTRQATSETTFLPKLAAERGQALLQATGQLPQPHLAWQQQQVEKASSSNRSSAWGTFCMSVTVPRSQRTLMRTPTMIWTFDKQAAAHCTRGRTCPHALLMLPAPSACNVNTDLCNAAGKMVLSRDP